MRTLSRSAVDPTGRLEPAALRVEARTTRLGCKVKVSAAWDPSSLWRSRSPMLNLASSAMGCRTVVSGGWETALNDTSSYPVTIRSDGTRTPAS